MRDDLSYEKSTELKQQPFTPPHDLLLETLHILNDSPCNLIISQRVIVM